MTKINKICQSCAMPMNKDEKGGGTNADGSKNLLYCSYCYQSGSFTKPNITAEEMQIFVKQKLIEMKFPKFVAWFFSRNIPKLKRWK